MFGPRGGFLPAVPHPVVVWKVVVNKDCGMWSHRDGFPGVVWSRLRATKGHRSVNERVFHRCSTIVRVGCAQGYSNIGVSAVNKRADPLVCVIGSDEQSAESYTDTRARSNGYSTTVSAEGNRLMNERVSHHRVVSGVLRDAQTSAYRSHKRVQTLWCVLESDEQRVTETSSE